MDIEFNILAVSRDEQVKGTILESLEGDMRRVEVVSEASDAIERLERDGVDLVIADSSVSEAELAKLAERLQEGWYRKRLVALLDRGSIQPVATRVDTFLEKPINITELREIVERAQQRKKVHIESQMVGRSEQMEQIIETIIQIAPTDVAVLITGESGTGKELIARAIHDNSPRRFRPFLAVNCGALAEGILESELFGHEKGAFTGAVARRKGVFELAHGGTIFLDEIGEMSLATQVKFLRVLEHMDFMRVGGAEAIKVDVRIIAATNRDLTEAVTRGELRRDLYYRLKVFEIYVPPLRERREDIPLLIEAFVKKYCEEHNVQFPGLSKDAIEILKRYSWPGNVRELKNLIESMIVLSPKSPIKAADIPKYLDESVEFDRNLPVRLHKTPDQSEREIIYRTLLALREDIAEMKKFLLEGRGIPRPIPVNPYESPPFTEEVEEEAEKVEDSVAEAEVDRKTIKEMEREMIRKALEETGGNRRRAARMLGIGERTLYRKIKRYGL